MVVIEKSIPKSMKKVLLLCCVVSQVIHSMYNPRHTSFMFTDIIAQELIAVIYIKQPVRPIIDNAFSEDYAFWQNLFSETIHKR